MRPVSAAFLAAVATSHRVATRVEVLDGTGDVVYTSNEVLEGTVSLDQQAASRGRADVTFADATGLTPTEATDLLAPFDNELRISRGVIHADGTEELVSLLTMGIATAAPTSTATGLTVRVSGLDRSNKVILARFETSYQIAAGENYADAIQDGIAAGVPGLTYVFPVVSNTTPLLTAEEQGDRWDFFRKAAKAIGMELYFNGDGACVLAPVATAGTTAALALAEGAGGVLLSAASEWTSEGIYNKVIATGENTGDPAAVPVRGEATDDNPQSPTYYDGPFGHRPRWYSSSFLADTAQAQQAAAAILASSLGTTKAVNFGAVVNPALEPNDVITITRQDAGLNAETFIVDSLQIPLAAEGVMTGRARQVIA